MRAILVLLLLAVAGNAADREFHEIVRAISDRYHTRPVNIPFMGLVNTFTFFARPAGASRIDLAVFEDLGDGRMEPEELRRMVGGSWKPFVQVHSRKSGETTLIFMRPEGRDTRLLITTMERREATVVGLKLNVDALKKWLDEPGRSARERRHGD